MPFSGRYRRPPQCSTIASIVEPRAVISKQETPLSNEGVVVGWGSWRCVDVPGSADVRATRC
jgi:hypothetical protein